MVTKEGNGKAKRGSREGKSLFMSTFFKSGAPFSLKLN